MATLSLGLTVALGLLSLFVGALIGCIGIGGVLLVPGLAYVGGIDFQTAIATSMLSFLLSSGMGVWLYYRRGSVDKRMAAILCAGAVPSAYLGAELVPMISVIWLEFLVAIAVLASGIDSLKNKTATSDSAAITSSWQLVLIGLLVGLGSSLTGTGGPLLLIPVLLWLRVAPLMAIGLAQVIVLPIGGMASVSHLLAGNADIPMAVMIAVLLGAGVWLGAHIAHAISSTLLKKLVSAMLVCTGAAMVVRISTSLM